MNWVGLKWIGSVQIDPCPTLFQPSYHITSATE